MRVYIGSPLYGNYHIPRCPATYSWQVCRNRGPWLHEDLEAGLQLGTSYSAVLLPFNYYASYHFAMVLDFTQCSWNLTDITLSLKIMHEAIEQQLSL